MPDAPPTRPQRSAKPAPPLPRLYSRGDLEHDAAFRARMASTPPTSVACAPRGSVPTPDPALTLDALQARVRREAGFPPPPPYDDTALVLAQPLLKPGKVRPPRARRPLAVQPSLLARHLQTSPAELMSTRGPSGAPGGAQ